MDNNTFTLKAINIHKFSILNISNPLPTLLLLWASGITWGGPLELQPVRRGQKFLSHFWKWDDRGTEYHPTFLPVLMLSIWFWTIKIATKFNTGRPKLCVHYTNNSTENHQITHKTVTTKQLIAKTVLLQTTLYIHKHCYYASQNNTQQFNVDIT